MALGEKIIAGSILLIAIYLVVTNGSGTSTAVGAISGAYTSGVKALQGR